MRVSVIVPIVLALAGLAGCRAFRDEPCSARQPYQSATSVPPLVAAEGGAPPNTRNALKIPDVSAAARPQQARCLDEPPRFYDDSGKAGAKPTPPQSPAAEAPPAAPSPQPH